VGVFLCTFLSCQVLVLLNVLTKAGTFAQKSNWTLKMNEKYPLTCDLKTEKNHHIDDFLWWKQPIARNILMVFWSAIIPLIFILKYALHVF